MSLIGTPGALIGPGGAEFRLPALLGRSRLQTLEAVIFNKAMSLVVVSAALLFGAIPSLWLLTILGLVLLVSAFETLKHLH